MGRPASPSSQRTLRPEETLAESAPLLGLAPPAPPSLGARRLACGTLFGLFGAAFGHFFSQLPETKARLGVGDGAFGALLLADDVGSLTALVAVRQLPRLRQAPGVAPLMGAAVALAAGTANLVRRAPTFAGAMLAFGACTSIFDVAANVQMVALEADSGRPETSLLHGLFSLGQLAGSAAGAATTRAALPFVPRVGGAAAALAVAYLLHLPLLRAPARTATPGGQEASDAADAQAHDGAAPAPRAQRRAVATLAALGALSSLAEGAASEWPGVYLREALGASFGTANLAALAYAGGMAGSRLLGGWAVGRLGARPVLAAGGVLVAASVGVALVHNHPSSVLAAVAATGAGLANVTPCTISAAGRLPGDVGAAVATLTLAQQLGFFAGPPLIGALAHALGLRVALGVVPLIGVALAIGSLAMPQAAAPEALAPPGAQEALAPPGSASLAA